MTRGTFLKLLSTAAIYPLASQLSWAKSYVGDSKQKVIVIGAGIAGLTAAKYLQERGCDVEVLEARSRIGGRIWTDESMGDPIDFGASWIHGFRHNPITKIAKEAKISLKHSEYDNIGLYDEKGLRLTQEKLQAVVKNGRQLLRRAQHYANRQSTDISTGQAIREVLKYANLNAKEKELFYWHVSTMELDPAMEFEGLSAWSDRERKFGGDDVLFPNGYGQVPNAMAKGLEIRLNQQVELIEWVQSGKGARVKTATNSFEADHVLVTVPLGVLKKGNIRFSPSLPAQKQNAIDRLQMGNLNKVVLKFDEAKWPMDIEWFSHASSERGYFPEFMNWAKLTGKPYLMGFVGNAQSLKLDLLTENDQKREALSVLSKLFPAMERSKLEEFRYSAWAKDEFAYGSYSCLPVGVSGKEYDVMAESIGTLGFAGEGTMRRYPGTVHGAYLSGIREAKRILKWKE